MAFSFRRHAPSFYAALLVLFTVTVACPAALLAQEKVDYNAQEKPIYDQIKSLRSLPDDVRARTTKQIALEIRDLPPTLNKLRLAQYLASRATEGDFGRETLQEVATTLAGAVQQAPADAPPKLSAAAYNELAQLARYEHVKVSLESPQFREAMTKLNAEDERRQQVNFTLTDLNGKTWTLKDLKGKVVLVNFWATWCPPCQKEMPDLEALYTRFKEQGFVVLAISEDDETEKVGPFIAERKISFPVLLDPGQKVNNLFAVEVFQRVSSTTAKANWWRNQSICGRNGSSLTCCNRRGCNEVARG